MLKSGQPEVEAAARSCHNYLQLAPDSKNKITIQLFILLVGVLEPIPASRGEMWGTPRTGPQNVTGPIYSQTSGVSWSLGGCRPVFTPV